MEMEVFENTEFGAIRTIVDENGNVLFCGSDAAKALGYQKPQNAIRMHCRRYALKQGIPHPQNPNKTIEMLFISEPDLYRLIAHSKLPAAQQFEAWIYETVLPSIRKHGAYITPQTLDQLIAFMKLMSWRTDKSSKVLIPASTESTSAVSWSIR